MGEEAKADTECEITARDAGLYKVRQCHRYTVKRYENGN